MTSYLMQKLGLASISSSKLELASISVDTEAAAAAAVEADNSDINEIESSKIKIMRTLCEIEEPCSKDEDDYTMRRFLRARDLDVEKASKLFLKYRKFRKESVPNGFISASEVSNDLSHDKLFTQGLDKMGRPIVVGFGGRHKQTSIDEFKRYVTFSLDKICARMPGGQEKFLSIADLEGWGYSNSDIRGSLAALSILQDCYPERLGKLYIIHVPSIFMTAWKVIYPFIDEKTTKKIIFVDDKNMKSTLLTDIDENQLPEIYGGKLPLVPIQEC